MRKVLIFTILLLLGVVLSQWIPLHIGDSYDSIKLGLTVVMLVCLSYIMINVGIEFEIEKTNLKSYKKDYIVAMFTAALPWIMVTIYFLALMPKGSFMNWDAWRETLLLGRFAAPTSAGILFTMLLAAGLGTTWMFKKARILAIFDDLDTILLMIPLQIIMVGLKGELLISLVIMGFLIYLAWKKMNHYKLPHGWVATLGFATLITLICETVYYTTKYMPDTAPVLIEVLLPSFVLGVVMSCNHHDQSKSKEKANDVVSYIFMFLVGMSTPFFINSFTDAGTGVVASVTESLTASMQAMSIQEILFHVLVVTILSNIGKCVPLLYYKKEASFNERLALSISMFARGEVGAGILMIGLGYGIGGPIMIIAILSLTLNLVLTSVFIVMVKKLLSREKKYQLAD